MRRFPVPSFPCLTPVVGVINVLIIFNVLRALGPAMKPAVSADSEKGRSKGITISRPMCDWKPQPTSEPKIQGSVTKMAPPACSPDAILHGGRSNIYSLAKSLFRPHKKTRSTTSITHLLAPTPPSRTHSVTSSFGRSESLFSAPLVGEPIAPAPVIDAELVGPPVPPKAIQKGTQPAPSLNHFSIDLPPQHGSNPTSLSPPPRGKRSRISRDLSPIPGSPALPVVPFLEVTLCSPTTSLTEDGTLINMYFSRYPTMSAELPPFPDTAGHRDSSVSLSLSGSEPPVSPATGLPAPSAVDLPVAGSSEGVGLPLKAAVSIGAVGGRPSHAHPPPRPELPSVHASSLLADTTDADQYSSSKVDAPPSSVVGAFTGASTQSRASLEGRTSVQDRPALRALPLPPSRPSVSLAQNVRLHKSSSSSSRYGYL